jgi:ComF family protein
MQSLARTRSGLPGWPGWPGLPSQCEVCRRWSPAAEASALCADCVARFGTAVPRCSRCGLRLGLAAAACGGCLRDPPPFEHTVCAADYAFPWDRLIAAFKFNGRVELASVLAARITAAVQGSAAPRPDLVLPVPLAPGRLSGRGYNQAWELARRVARAVGVAAEGSLLLRHLDTAQQAGLGRAERQRNLRLAFRVEPRRRGELLSRRVALVDDVMTTGATAREAAAVLLRAGAAAVDLWVLARTPDMP